jgi:hypothetical protein
MRKEGKKGSKEGRGSRKGKVERSTGGREARREETG